MPDGGLWASAPDMARWASAFLQERDGGGGLLTAGTVAEMLTQQSYGPVGPDSADGAQQQRGIGLGWHLDLPNQFTHWGFTGTLVWGDQVIPTPPHLLDRVSPISSPVFPVFGAF